MKKSVLLITLGLALSANAYAEKGDVLQGDVQQVVEFQGMSKDAIYTGSRQWVATTFNSAQSVIQMDDRQSGVIIGKGNMKYPCYGSWLCTGVTDNTIKFTVKIEAKDNKARVTFSDIVQYVPPSQYNSRPIELPVTNRTKSLDTVGQVKEKFGEVITEYKNTVSKTASANSNW